MSKLQEMVKDRNLACCNPWGSSQSDRTEPLNSNNVTYDRGSPGGTSGKEVLCQCRRHKRHGSDPWVRKIPWRRIWPSTAVFLPGESHGQRSLAGCSPWGHKELDMTEYRIKCSSPNCKLYINVSIVSS